MNAEDVSKWLAYDRDTGLLTWKTSPNRRKPIGSPAGSKTSQSYILIMIGNERHAAHRFAWAIHHGNWPKGVIDHINGNGMDNRIDNLRDVTQSVNMQNLRQPLKNNKSGLLGVRTQKSKINPFYASININGSQTYLGCFNTKEQAHAAYVEAKRVHHAGCTI